MYNKKVLSEATANLDKAKAPTRKQDIITDPMGQWKYPGQNTRIPGGDITMQGVPYPVWAQPNVGPGVLMQPDQDYQFPGADYVDEFPMAKRGGALPKLPKKKNAKAYSRSLTATNKLFAQNPLTKKSKSKKNKIFNPLSKYFQDGGMLQENEGAYIETELSNDEIQTYKDGGYIVEELPQAQDGLTLDEAYARYNKLRNKIIPLKEYNYSDKEQSELLNLEKIINSRLNIVRPDWEVKNRTWIPYPKSGVMMGHLFYDYTPFYKNNKPPVLPTRKLPQVETPDIIPSNYNYTPQKPETIRTASRSQTVMEPDPNRAGKFRYKELRQVPYSAYFPGEGWEDMDAPRVMYYNPTTEEETTKRFQQGGYIDAELTPEEINWYRSQGYQIEDID